MTHPDKNPKADVDQAMRDLRERGKVKDPGEIGHQIRVIKRSDLRTMMEELLRKYGGMADPELVERIGILERQLAETKAELEARGREALEDLQRRLMAESGRNAELEGRISGLQAENDRLSADLAAARRALTSNDAKRCLELEKRVMELEARVHELEMGLDYYGLEVEPDADAFRSALEGAARRSNGAAADIGSRARAADETVAALQASMYDGKGSVSVIVDLAKALERRRNAEVEARTVGAG
jgi:uncharacterized small protein (DUF1192 family)